MDRLNMTDAFNRYHARLVNNLWAVSAIAVDGALVVSCWDFTITPVNAEVMVCTDSLSRWTENNRLGNNLLRDHLNQAILEKLPIRLVVAHPAPESAKRIAEYFHVRSDVVGRIVGFDGDQFVLEFTRSSPPGISG
jgi:hypothetical protein